MASKAAIPSQDDRPIAPAWPEITRLDSLDLLRGICALAVAVYHFNLWGGLTLPAAFSGILSVFGTYGVSVFFVLSGFSLTHAYGDKFKDGISYNHLARYIRRRIGRLMPLFSLVVLASVAGKLLSTGNTPDGLTIIANILLVFGFVDPSNTPVIGGWSIGLEVVFYILFPIIVVLRRHALLILTLSVFLALWTEIPLAEIGDLGRGWPIYVQPANHFVFFASGVVSRLYIQDFKLLYKWYPCLAVMVIIAVSAIVSYGADTFSVVTGYRRYVLVVLSIILVIVASGMQPSRGVKRFASILGGASYPFYLIHPLFFALASRLIPGGALLYSVLFASILFAAIAMDRMIDKPLQRLIKSAGW